MFALKPTIPSQEDACFHSPSIEFEHRTAGISMCVTVDLSGGRAHGPTLDILVNDAVEEYPVSMLTPAEQERLAELLFQYFYKPVQHPLPDEWYALLEKALDLYIDKHVPGAAPKEASDA